MILSELSNSCMSFFISIFYNEALESLWSTPEYPVSLSGVSALASHPCAHAGM